MDAAENYGALAEELNAEAPRNQAMAMKEVNGLLLLSLRTMSITSSVLDKTKIKETLGINIPYWTDTLKQCIANMGILKYE